jgi:hypothetical protein
VFSTEYNILKPRTYGGETLAQNSLLEPRGTKTSVFIPATYYKIPGGLRAKIHKIYQSGNYSRVLLG